MTTNNAPAINTGDIRDLCKKLDDAQIRLHEAIEARRMLNFGGHQEPVSVCIGNTRINVSVLSRETGYRQTVIRGREMIVLGMQKVANESIEECQKNIAEISEQIAKASGGQA